MLQRLHLSSKYLVLINLTCLIIDFQIYGFLYCINVTNIVTGYLLKTEYLIKRKLNGKEHRKKIFIFDNMNHDFPNNCIVSTPLNRQVRM